LGYFLRQRDCFAPLREHVKVGSKTVLHTPHQKLLDVVVSMLADCTSLQQINTRLRPDTALAAAWGREAFADQAPIPPLTVTPRRTAVEHIYVREGRALHHPFDQELLCLDIDLPGLPAGRHAEASAKGYCSGKKTAAGASSPG